MVVTVVEVRGSGLGSRLYFVLVVPLCICLVPSLVQLEGSIGGHVVGHVRVKLVGEVRFVLGITPHVLDQFGASELVDPVVLG